MTDTCPTCGSLVRIVGDTTMHYEPMPDTLDLDALDALREAATAMVRWFDCELGPYNNELRGTFEERMDLCAYAEWSARTALGQDVGEFEGIPRLVIALAPQPTEEA